MMANGDFDEAVQGLALMDEMERNRLCSRLQAVHVPESAARWIADHIPAQLLPQNLSARFEAMRYNFGVWLRGNR